MLVVSQTGSGKTLMFLLPLLQQLAASTSNVAPGSAALLQPQALVLLPTPDLAVQVAAVASRLAAALPSPLTVQLLTDDGPPPIPTGPGIAVATPDSFTSLLNQYFTRNLPQACDIWNRS